MGQELAFLDPARFIADCHEKASLPEEISIKDSEAIIENCVRNDNEFTSESLPTLLYAYRFFDEKEYAEWRQIWDAAATSLFNRKKMIESTAELLEVNSELAEVTVIEDKLQEVVVESIDKLERANIKIWMLSGDKRETAINIGHSCGLMKAIVDLSDEYGLSGMVARVRSWISVLTKASFGSQKVELRPNV